MKLLQQLNEAAEKLELHIDGHPRRSIKGDFVRGYLYDRRSDKEQEVVIHYDYEKADAGDYHTPASPSNISIYKVTKPGGGEINLDKIDTHDAEVELHDHHNTP